LYHRRKGDLVLIYKYKIIVAPTPDRLELLVNEYLKTHSSSYPELVGPPSVFGHEEYVQTITIEALS
jgi:hypothetical protein